MHFPTLELEVSAGDVLNKYGRGPHGMLVEFQEEGVTEDDDSGLRPTRRTLKAANFDEPFADENEGDGSSG